ncbi:MAG: tetratricopeptide (TPR) repeat protein [Saprospiraceae bacterium]|jgi:tetratricopeptide (TPR) repeat protein
MKRIFIITVLVSLCHVVVGQDYQTKFAKYSQEKDTLAQRKLLVEWEIASPFNAELYTCYFNYYFSKSKESFITLNSGADDSAGYQIYDSTNKVMGSIGEKTYFDSTTLQKAFDKIGDGIGRHPNRLDMRFGKIYAHGDVKDWESFTSEIIRTVDFSIVINNKWTWTNDEPVNDPKEFFLSSVQKYAFQLYNAQDDSLLKNMRQISNRVLKYYPNHVESLTNVAVTYIILGEYDKGIPSLLKAEKIHPEDAIVLGNIARVYKLKKDTETAVKYYEKAILYGDSRTKKYAQQQIDIIKKEAESTGE